ncbi:uncharacterized protein LOC114325245 isoform X1 [Diabrotica virgifera virgifera]|uniref:Tudor domain-containing protein n=1 Tax=Diabrotica virgifera virgifera TaxID=50390 RepID=A0ABM5IB81_DIAVI|nr:uncharacterized protein LOC114325245 isoform X1 [Diabrotica virgifera virgifera]
MERNSRCDVYCKHIAEDEGEIMQKLQRLRVKVSSIVENSSQSQVDVFRCQSSLLDVLKVTSTIISSLDQCIQELESTYAGNESADTYESANTNNNLPLLSTTDSLYSFRTSESGEQTETERSSIVNEAANTELLQVEVTDRQDYDGELESLHSEYANSETRLLYNSVSFETPEKDTSTSKTDIKQCFNDFIDDNTHDVEVSSCSSSSSYQSLKPFHPPGYKPTVEKINHQFDNGSNPFLPNFKIKPSETTIKNDAGDNMHSLADVKLEPMETAIKNDNGANTRPLEDVKLKPMETAIKHNNGGNNPSLPDIKLKPVQQIVKNEITKLDVEKKTYTPKKKKKNNKSIKYEIPSKREPVIDEECFVSHIVSPNEFYIHLVDEESLLVDDISDVIGKNITKSKKIKYNSKEEALDDVGRFGFLFLESNKLWYRVEVLDGLTDQKHDNILVQLVDFGNIHLVSYKHLHTMTKDLNNIPELHYPKLAVRCQLPRLYPPHSKRLNKLSKWPEDTIEIMHQLCGFNEEITSYFKLVYVAKEEDFYVVDIYRVDLESTSTLSQILLDYGAAVQIIDECDTNNMELERFVDDIDDAEQYNINEAITGYDPTDEARICRFTRPDGTCFKKHCKLEHIQSRKDGFTTDQDEVYTKAMCPLILPSMDSNVPILITGNISVCRFYAQIINNPYNTGRYIMDLQFHNLDREMNAVETVKKYETFKIDPALGEIVLVWLDHWKRWSRAIVRELLFSGDDRKVQVYMLDYGEYQIRLTNELRKILPQFLLLPFQAVECYIQDYELNTSCPLKEANKFFDINMHLRNFTAITKSEDEPLKVILRNQTNTKDVGQTLEEHGFARRTRKDINVSDNCYIQLS